MIMIHGKEKRSQHASDKLMSATAVEVKKSYNSQGIVKLFTALLTLSHRHDVSDIAI